MSRNFKRKGGPVFYRAWKEWEESDYAVGTIVDTSVDKKYKRTNYLLKLEEFNFEAEDHNGKELKEGDTLVLNGCGLLEKHLGNSEIGDAVKVVYAGQSEITSGEWEGTKAHNIEVYLEEGNESSPIDEDDDIL